MELNWLDLLTHGGYSIAILVICSIISVAVIIEKFIAFRALRSSAIEPLAEKFNRALEQNNSKAAMEISYNANETFLMFNVKSPLGPVFKHIVNNYHFSKEDLIDSSYNQLDKEVSRLEKGLGILGTLGAVSPFIGLFGTVIGIINAFQALSQSDAQNYQNVMKGISEALIATAGGLFVAIPAVMFYNYFIKKIKLSMPFFDDVIHNSVRIIKSDIKK